MKKSIKDLLKIPGVHGYVISQDKRVQIKLPSKHPFAGAKEQFQELYAALALTQQRPGNIVEIFLEDLTLTVFPNTDRMLTVVSSSQVNQAFVRMTGKLLIADMNKES
ncbi:MAG TPA: hypothetical protein ENN34_08540 [Deltaproteobacteria bacterium]|nr:hypothetical protein [Deltaproteobacteria bacterium]